MSKWLLIFAGALILIAAVFFGYLQVRDTDEKVQPKNTEIIQLRPVDITQVEISPSNKGLDAYTKLVGKEAVWRCLGLEYFESQGIVVYNMSLTTGKVKLGKTTTKLKDPVRFMYIKPKVCNIKVGDVAYDAYPSGGKDYDTNTMRAARNFIVAMVQSGYGALSPKLGTDLTKADVRTLTAAQQVALLAKQKPLGQSANLTCLGADGKNVGFTPVVMKTPVDVPKVCQWGVYTDKESVVWAVHGSAKDKLMVRFLF